MKPAAPRLAAALLGACDALPLDPEGTSRRVEATGRLRVGIDAGDLGGTLPQAHRLVARVAAEAQARPELTSAPLEPLLQRLETGDLDMVVGRFAKPTPWQTRVALAPPIAASGADEHRMEVRAAMRNGENRWIMRVERASRAVGGNVAR